MGESYLFIEVPCSGVNTLFLDVADNSYVKAMFLEVFNVDSIMELF
jgi:hypothetical protein